jgi:hypothetical protein
MSVTINGTTGIAGTNGSAGTPAVQGEDTNTGIFFPAADTVAVATGGTERVRVDSSGNVGIGTSSPTSLGTGITTLELKGNSASQTDRAGGINFMRYDGNPGMYVYHADDASYISSLSTYPLLIQTNGSERMRITSAGNVGIGLATPSDVLDVAAPIDGGIRISESTNNNRFCKITQSTARLTLSADPDGTTSTSYINFLVDGTEWMRVHALGVVTMPAVYSDTVTGRDLFIAADGQLGYVSSTRASKTNIQDLSDVSWLYSLNPVSFQYRVKNEDDTYSNEAQPQPEYGLIAEEVELINPDLVFYDETENGRELRGIQYSRLIAPLLKAIQEQQSLITDLTARLTALEAQ